MKLSSLISYFQLTGNKFGQKRQEFSWPRLGTAATLLRVSWLFIQVETFTSSAISVLNICKPKVCMEFILFLSAFALYRTLFLLTLSGFINLLTFSMSLWKLFKQWGGVFSVPRPSGCPYVQFVQEKKCAVDMSEYKVRMESDAIKSEKKKLS